MSIPDLSALDSDDGRESAMRAETETLLNRRLPGDQQVIFEQDAHTGDLRPWGCAPVQAEGTIGGKPFYFRFRMNRAALTIYAGGGSGRGEDDEAVSTASEDDVYAGEDYAGCFDSADDAAATFARLASAQAPVHPLDNPTTVQRMEAGILHVLLARAEDFAEEEAVFTERPDSDVAMAAYPNWLALPEVAEWVAAGRPAHAKR